MSHHCYERKTCRLCNSENINLMLSLTPTALCDEYLAVIREQSTFPLDLYQCSECQFIQLSHVVHPEEIYSDYIYLTTSSSDLKNHFESYADQVTQNLNLTDNKRVVDIGSNDGTLLGFFQKKGLSVLGVEPCKKIADYATEHGINTTPAFFDLSLARNIRSEFGSADLITLNNVFANIDDLSAFSDGLIELLSDEGVLIIESSYLLDMINHMVFDFIYHEHLSYFSIIPLERFFEKRNLRLIRIDHVATKGGSLRYYFARKTSSHKVDSSVCKLRTHEMNENINIDYFKAWNKKIEACRLQLTNAIAQYPGKKIVCYGASATSTTLIYHFQLQKYIDCLIDDNVRKVGTYSPGLHLPVRKLSDVTIDNNTVVIILAWRFADQIIKKLPQSVCAVIIPLPQVQIVSAQHVEKIA